MTTILYMKNIDGNYIKKFTATVTKKKQDYICLDQTAFYPVGGGQPSDTGSIKWGNKESKIHNVIKEGDMIKHFIDGEIPVVGTKIMSFLDWMRRYNHMKMHTAQHILSGVVFDEYQARTVGNQIHEAYSRVDFQPVRFNDDDLEFIEKTCNDIFKKHLSIKIYNEERTSIEKRIDAQRCNLDLLPKFISILRIVETEGFDICPCAGTHVQNTKELPLMHIIKRETKGKKRERIIYTLSNDTF